METLPIHAEFFPQWAAALGIEIRFDLTYGRVLGQLARSAGEQGAITLPEPGVLATAFAVRDQRSEQQNGIGFGFYPDSSELLIVQGSALMYADLDEKTEVGIPAVLAVLGDIVATLRHPRPGQWG
ncbi:hypothetical protein ACIP5Y_00775 [Nocardia sp. NPDC088792]|uniref:hypothetical protein n=1 Tax=Nocardia sp. NPDC088792 TaxID=3364332 RepID=UPI00382EB9A4